MTTTKSNTTGVLFVHGIGEQAHRDTLLHFGQPIIEWLKQHIEINGGDDVAERLAYKGTVSVRHPSYLGEDSTLNTPESVVVEINQDTNNENSQQVQTEKWLLTESWWADVFDQPSFSNLARWIFMIGPWLVISHVARRDRINKTFRPLAFAKKILALAFAFVVQFLVLLLSVLVIIPIPKLRSALSGLLSTLTATLGDAYVLVSSPIQHAAAVRKVLDGIEWLDEQCDSIVVIAHSQGAAIASEALSQCENKKIKKLITYGSGLSKLVLLTEIDFQEKQSKNTLNQITLSNVPKLARYTTPVFFILLLLTPLWVPILPGVDVKPYVWPTLINFMPDNFVGFLNWVPAGIVGLYLLFFLWIILFSSEIEQQGYRDRITQIYDEITGKGIDWINIYSTHDPVSNGKMDLDDSAYFKQIEVHNRRSMFADHTSYWSNQDEFVTNVVRNIDSVGTGAVTCFTKDTVSNTKLLEGITWRRARHTKVLSYHKWLLWPSLIIISYYMYFELYKVGFYLIDMLETSNLFDWVGEILGAVGSVFAAIMIYFGLNEDQLQVTGPFSLGLITIFIAGYFWHLLFMYLWNEYDEYQGRTSPLFCQLSLLRKNKKKVNSQFYRYHNSEQLKNSFILFISVIPAVIAVLHFYYVDFGIVWGLIANVFFTIFVGMCYFIFSSGLVMVVVISLYSLYKMFKKYIFNKNKSSADN